MSTINATKGWIAYFVVYAGGFAGVMYLTRTYQGSWVASVLPFAFPIVLVILGAWAARGEARARPRREPEPTSLLGRRVPRIGGEPMRWTTAVALAMTPQFYIWVFPDDAVNSIIRLSFMLWWLACIGFTALILPRLLVASTSPD
jgi:hypothetical protein